MNRWNTRAQWPQNCRGAVAAVTTRGISLPKRVAEALAVLDRIEATAPIEPSPTVIRDAIVAGADETVITRLLLIDLTHSRYRGEWSQARVDAAGIALAVLRDSADEILPKLREQAQDCIEKLTAVANLGGARLEDLVKAGRTDDARQLAGVDVVAAEADALYEILDFFAAGAHTLSVNSVDVSRWSDYELAQHHVRGTSPAARYLAGIRAGVPLWCPTPTEARKAAQILADKFSATASAVAATRRGQGSYAAFL